MRRLNSSSTRQNRNLENLLQISNLLFQFFIKAAHNSYILCSSLATIMSTFVTLSYIKSIRRLMTKIRNKDTPPVEFRHYARKLMLILSEECLAYVQRKDVDVITPTGSVYAGYEILNESNIVAVSIIRAGDSLLDAFMEVCPSAQVGKVLIQRNEETAEPILFYTKLPPLTGKYVILLDPMLGTGGSCVMAIQELLKKGADVKNMMFLNVLASPEGIAFVHSKYPDLLILSGEVDAGLNEKKYIVPGLGDYGDRYFGTL